MTCYYPKQFSPWDPELQSIGIGQLIPYGGGCVQYWPVNAGLSTCKQFINKDGVMDKNLEYTLSIGGGNCNMCSDISKYGCGETPGGGPIGTCDYPNSWMYGTNCLITRNAYMGNPAACSLRATSAVVNKALTGYTGEYPFSWAAVDPKFAMYGVNSCDPNLQHDKYASTIATYCRTLSIPGTRLAWETGQPTNGDSTGYCSNYVNAMNSGGNKGAAQTVLAAAVDYMVTTPGFNDFGQSNSGNAKTVSNLLQFCSNFGTCDAQLKNMCSNYSREEIFNAYKTYLDLTKVNPNDPNAVAYKNIFQACGCHLPPSQYTEWGNLGVDEVNTACDPMCMLPNVIPQFNNGVKAQCSQSLCVLDNITIDIINSQTGNINFNTLCGGTGCANGNCRCIFSNINVIQTGSSVGGINFSQNCGSCSTPDPNNPGNFLQIDCKSGLPSGVTPTSDTTWTKIINWMKDNKWKTAIIIIAIVVVIYLTYRFFTAAEPLQKPVTTKVTLQDLYGDYADYF